MRIYADQLEISKYFHGHFLVFTGVIFDFFHVQDFSFHGCKLTKFFTGKIEFFTGKLPYFSRPADLASRPKKNSVCLSLPRTVTSLARTVLKPLSFLAGTL